VDGEHKLTLIIISITAICITVLYSFLFISLWPYREWVGLSLLVLIIASVCVFLRGRLTEQNLRVIRYRHAEETPLDERGEPMYYHSDYQPNPHRR
jgi:uncharacterized membrane protein